MPLILCLGFICEKKSMERQKSYLAYFAKQNPERRSRRLSVVKTNRVGEAYKAYEELLFSGYLDDDMVFQSLYMLAMEDGDREKAHMLVEKQRVLAGSLIWENITRTFLRMDLATAEKDAIR